MVYDENTIRVERQYIAHEIANREKFKLIEKKMAKGYTFEEAFEILEIDGDVEVLKKEYLSRSELSLDDWLFVNSGLRPIL